MCTHVPEFLGQALNNINKQVQACVYSIPVAHNHELGDVQQSNTGGSQSILSNLKIVLGFCTCLATDGKGREEHGTAMVH